jgi:LPS O-antigen subunit length determinant protein (WzzB/FepE family)
MKTENQNTEMNILEQYLNQAKEELIEDVLYDFQDKITPRLKKRMMNTPLVQLRGKLENLRKKYLVEYSKL